jgi:predicted Zn-dependent peptidase
VGEVLGLIAKETGSLAGDGITAEELEAAKGYVVGTTLLGLEEPATCMSRLGYLEVTYGRVEPVDAYLDRIRAVTLEDVARVAARCLGPEPVVASVGPRSPRTPGRA